MGTGPSETPTLLEAALARRNKVHLVLHPSKMLIGAHEAGGLGLVEQQFHFHATVHKKCSGQVPHSTGPILPSDVAVFFLVTCHS